MLQEFIEHKSIDFRMRRRELQEILFRETIMHVREKTGVNLTQNLENLTSEEIENIVEVFAGLCAKIYSNPYIAPGNKGLIINFVVGILYEAWKKSDNLELFFIKIRQHFTPAQITAALTDYVQYFDDLKWITKFFAENLQVFPRSSKKIRTIGVYYFRVFNGGIERFVSKIIPVYLQLGYRVILFTDVARPEIEFPLPALSENFERAVFSTPRQAIFERLQEMSELFQKYEIDIFVSNMGGETFLPFTQFLFCRLSGVKAVLELHISFKWWDFRFPNVLSYPLADAMVVISRTRREFLKNLGVRSYYIPNPMTIDKKEKFSGRNTKRISNTILWVGRIAGDKNVLAVVPIMKLVTLKIPNARLKIVGAADNRPLMEKLQELIRLNKIEDNIEFCGYHTDVSKFYKSADVMLTTSPHEGWSLVIAESKFYELPLVLYELPDNELTREGKGCIAVPQGDYRAAADAIVKILTDGKLRRKLSADARASLQPFIDYDIGGAWKKLFDDLENDVPPPQPNFEVAQIQNILLEENFRLQHQLQNSEQQ